MGRRGLTYPHCQGMAIKMLVQKGRGSCIWLYLSGKDAVVFVDELSAAVDSGMGSIPNRVGSNHCLN